jgi:Protein of unknown function (DUF4242)
MPKSSRVRREGNTKLRACHDPLEVGNPHAQVARLALVIKFSLVPQFVIERDIPGAGTLSESQIRDIALHSLETLQKMGPQIQWLHSYVTEDKVYCLYLAPDEDSIREHARRAGIPADRVAAVRRLIDPTKVK